jgi:hypothetical protein
MLFGEPLPRITTLPVMNGRNSSLGLARICTVRGKMVTFNLFRV